MVLAKRQVNPSRSSIALSRMAPPSELACGWSNFAMIGLEIPWTWRALCAIQALAIELPRFCAMSRLVNALFAHFRGSMALFFHLSRIIRARTHPARVARARFERRPCRRNPRRRPRPLPGGGCRGERRLAPPDVQWIARGGELTRTLGLTPLVWARPGPAPGLAGRTRGETPGPSRGGGSGGGGGRP